MTLAYTTELAVEQYQLIASLLPPETATGRPRAVNMMLVGFTGEAWGRIILPH